MIPSSIHRKNTKRFVALPTVKAAITVSLVLAIIILAYNFWPILIYALAEQGNNRLETPGWQNAQTTLAAAQPTYRSTYTYYKLQKDQNLEWAARYFGVSVLTLQNLNPGHPIWGVTIKIPPVQNPLPPFPPSQATTTGVSVTTDTTGAMFISNPFDSPTVYLTIPSLMQILQPYGAITQLGQKSFLINRPIFIQNNIITDITSSTVQNLYLLSNPNYHITTLSFWNSEALLSGVTVTSYDTVTKQPDTNYKDGRSFLRAYGSARMDILNSTISYLGMNKLQASNKLPQTSQWLAPQKGINGVSWSIDDKSYGIDDTTGWVENTIFKHNYGGALTYGAQGMIWRNNVFVANIMYGLDAKSNSNNATVIDNRFIKNGGNGFVASGQSDYNTIKNNISSENKSNGYALLNNANLNILKSNISISNRNDFVISSSCLDTILNNASYNPIGSQLRISNSSIQNYVINNKFYGGQLGVYLYGGINGAEITNNTFDNVSYQLLTHGATRVLFAGNQSNKLGYKLAKGDQVVFGINKLKRRVSVSMPQLNTNANMKN